MFKHYQLEYLSIPALIIFSVFLGVYFYSISTVYYLGIFLNFIGLLLFSLGKLNLREHWHNIYEKPQAEKLITNGIYSKIRHPIYVGLSLIFMGWTCLSNNLWLLRHNSKSE